MHNDKLHRLRFQTALAHYQGADGYTGVQPQTGSITKLDRWLLQRLLSLVNNPPIEVVLWNGEIINTSQETPLARLVFRTRSALFRILHNPGLNFGEAYSAGEVDVEGDLIRFLELVYRGGAELESQGKLSRRIVHWLRRARSNSQNGSRKNIHHHYDIGNDFYRLWLDDDMVYTCAYYPSPAARLEEAQTAKLDYVCRKLRLQPGETVVEAGCGWGALARFMARQYGVKVKAFNISKEQIAYARERADREGLGDEVEFIEDDYRNIHGRYNAFVSVGMLEHVGKEHYSELGAVVQRILQPQGRGLIHSIGRNKPMAMNAWIERRIFPGAYPPALREMLEILEPWNLSVLDIENLRLHYAKTLIHWLERYEQAAERVAEMYGEQFLRAWRLYLAGSVAAFTTGGLQLFQVVFSRSGVNSLPLTRAHLYDQRPAGLGDRESRDDVRAFTDE